MKVILQLKSLLYVVLHSIRGAMLFILLIPIQQNFAETVNIDDCENCFATELLDISFDELCVTYSLKISGLNCVHSLSHFTAEIVCGTVADAENSEGWRMEYNVLDPTTQIRGLKVDDIPSFSEDGKAQSFTLNYTVCAADSNCLELLKSSSFRVAYKAGTCVFIDTVEVAKEVVLSASLITIPVDCYGESSGEIDVTVNGGVAPYNFLWNTGATTEDLDGVPAGDYSVLITDNIGSELELHTTIDQNRAISAIADIRSADCGSSNGAIQLSVSGGIAPYGYKWSNDSINESISNLSSGIYTVEISDSIGCSNIFNYSVSEETTLRASLSSSMLECHEEGQGKITATVSGGNGEYTYLWSNGDTTQTITELNSGSYSVTITDSLGCSIQKNGYVPIKKLYVHSSVTAPICGVDTTGNVEIRIRNGNEPYDIQWSTGDSASLVEDLIPGWYWVTVTDTNGCTYKKNINVPEANTVQLNASFSLATCDSSDSSIIVNLNGSGGVLPYSFFKDGEPVESKFVVNKTGVYSITVVDANGCEATELVNVYRPESNLSINSKVTDSSCEQPETGSAVINISGGVSPYTVSWSDGVIGDVRSDLLPGIYTVTVVDAIGCESKDSVVIQSIDIPDVHIQVPTTEIICGSTDNLIIAETMNVVSSQWELLADDTGWKIESTELDRATINIGQGVASLLLNGYSEQGCLATDTLQLTCSTDDDGLGGTGDNPDGCGISCFKVISFNAWETYNDCVDYQLTLGTDGSCAHALSHVVIGLADDEVIDASNTAGWKMELNMLDPTTGLYGFKVDDIENFGDNGSEQFSVTFTICDNRQNEFPIAYKAGQCVFRDTVTVDIKDKPLVSVNNVFPNPFSDQVTIQVNADKPVDVKLEVFDVYGNKIEQLFDGELGAGITEFYFNGEHSKERLFLYRLVSKNSVYQGKLLKAN